MQIMLFAHGSKLSPKEMARMIFVHKEQQDQRG
jgi:hypothetical protein